MAKAAVRNEVLYLRAAGVDVGKRFVVACVRTPSPKGRQVAAGDRAIRHHGGSAA